MSLSKKKTVTLTEVVFIQVSFLTVGSRNKNNNNEHAEYHVTSYHSKVRSIQNKGVMFVFSLGHGVLVLFFCLVEAKVPIVNSNVLVLT